MVNNKDECAGRVEVRHGNVWQTVCDTDWNLNKAQVVCELLECGHAMNAPGAAHFGQGSGPVVEANPSCFDNVTSLQQCSLNGFRSATCGHDHDAGVLCAGKAFLNVVFKIVTGSWANNISSVFVELYVNVLCICTHFISDLLMQHNSGWSAAQVSAPEEWRSTIKANGELCAMMNGK